jgi:hypothetical protein
VCGVAEQIEEEKLCNIAVSVLALFLLLTRMVVKS